MAGAPTTRSLLLAGVLSLLLCRLLPALGGGPCPGVPSMTAERACKAVCGTPHMLRLCLRTLAPGAAAAAVTPVTDLAMAAVRSALDSYTATTAAATSLIDGDAVQDSEKAAYGDCMVGYGRARGAMARVADDLAGGCDKVEGLQRPDYTAGLRGMDMCSERMMDFPASPLHTMNLADRNKTMLAALLCSLVAPPPPGRR